MVTRIKNILINIVISIWLNILKFLNKLGVNMSTNSFVVNINETAAKLDMLDELNKKLTQANVDTLLAYDYEPLLTDLNKADSDVVNVSDNMETIKSVSANMESILAVNGEVDEARSILGSVQAEANTAIASVETATEDAIQAVNQTEDSVIQSVNTTTQQAINSVNSTKDLAILTVNQTRDEAVNTVGLEVDKAEQSAVNSEASAKRAEAAAEEAASKIGITNTIRPSSEAVDYLAPSEHAVALVKENLDSVEEDMSAISNAVNTNASAIITNTNAINNIVSSTQKLWKGTQAEFDALANKDDYFLSYVTTDEQNVLQTVYNGSVQILDLPVVKVGGAYVDNTTIQKQFNSVRDASNWIKDNADNIQSLSYEEIEGIATNTANLFAFLPNLTSLDLTNFNMVNVTNVEGMFRENPKLSSIIFPKGGFKATLPTSIDYLMHRSRVYSGRPLVLHQLFDNVENIISGRYAFNDSSVQEESSEDIPFNKKVADCSYMYAHNRTVTTVRFSGATVLENITGVCSSCVSLQRALLPDVRIILFASNAFKECRNLQHIDLSNLDCSQLIETSNMFYACVGVTTAYGRTQADCDILNATSGKPANVNFVVKP